MDVDGFTLGTGISSIVLGAIVAFGSIIQYLRTRQFPLRYLLMFLAGSSLVIIRSTVLAIPYIPVDDVNVASLTVNWFYQMYIPFLFCVFFEACRNMIITQGDNRNKNYKDIEERASMLSPPPYDTINNNTQQQNVTMATPAPSSADQKSSNRNILFPIYFAYLFTIVLIITNTIVTALQTPSIWDIGSSTMYEHIVRLSFFNVYGIWMYVLVAIIQVICGGRSLRRFITSLSIYLFTCVVAITGDTFAQSFMLNETEMENVGPLAVPIIQFVMIEMIGVFGLLYACLWCSTRYWISNSVTNKAVRTRVVMPLEQEEEQRPSYYPPNQYYH